MTQDNRSVSAGRDITGSIVITGDHNTTTLTTVQPPAPATVDIAAVLAELRAELAKVAGDRGEQVEGALKLAEAEARREQPDKSDVAKNVEAALGYARKAGEFGDSLAKVQDLVTRAVGWIGAASVAAGPLLALAGLTL